MDQLPQNKGQDPAGLVVINLDRRVDSQKKVGFLSRAIGPPDRQLYALPGNQLTRLQSRKIKGLRSFQF